MKLPDVCRLGIDIGSTTVKVVVLDSGNKTLFSEYTRHFSQIKETLLSIVERAHEKLGALSFTAMMTGSGGVSMADAIGVDFIQEVVATVNAVETVAPQTDVAIELGGEDA